MDSLPDEVILRVMTYLKVEDIVGMSKVSRQYHGIANDESIWKWYLQRDFGCDDFDYDFFLGTYQGDTYLSFYIDRYTNSLTDYIRSIKQLVESIRKYPKLRYSENQHWYNKGRRNTLTPRMSRFVREHITNSEWGIGDVCFHKGSFSYDGVKYEYKYQTCLTEDVEYVYFYVST